MTAIEEAVRAALQKLVIAFEHEIADVEGTVAVFTEALKELAPLDVEGGVARVIRTERYFPRPSILRGHALEEQLSRSVWAQPYDQGDDRICPFCNAEGFWLRGVQQPDPDPRWWPAARISDGSAAPKFHERIEILHDFPCRIRHRDQPVSFSGPRAVA